MAIEINLYIESKSTSRSLITLTYPLNLQYLKYNNTFLVKIIFNNN